MDINDRVRYLVEFLKELLPVCSVSITSDKGDLHLGKGKRIPEEAVWTIASNDSISVAVSGMYLGKIHLYTQIVNLYTQIVNLQSCRYYVKGQGKSLAKTFKLGLAETMLEFR